MLWDAWQHVKEGQLPVKSRLVFTYALGMAIFHLVGAGFWGFAHTLPQINYYTHGSQVTAAHGNMAFLEAYVLLNLTFFYYAMPELKGIGLFSERRGHVTFWWMCLTLLCMGLILLVGVVLPWWTS